MHLRSSHKTTAQGRRRRMAWLLASARLSLATTTATGTDQEETMFQTSSAANLTANVTLLSLSNSDNNSNCHNEPECNKQSQQQDHKQSGHNPLQHLRLPRLSLDWTTQAILATTTTTINAPTTTTTTSSTTAQSSLELEQVVGEFSPNNTLFAPSPVDDLQQQQPQQSGKPEWLEFSILEHQLLQQLQHPKRRELEWCQAVLDNSSNSYVAVYDAPQTSAYSDEATNETAISMSFYYNETLEKKRKDDGDGESELLQGALQNITSSNVSTTPLADSDIVSTSSTRSSPSAAPVAADERFVAAVDYASKSAGGLVLEKSKNFQGTSNLLTSDRDRYAIVECQEPTKWVVIGLSEDILVKRVVLAMYERYSSHVKEFSLFASTTATEWIELGNYTAASTPGEQAFDIPLPMWARYLKFQFLSYYGQEHYCTVSQIKVHGSTVLQGFHEQWQESDDNNDKDHDRQDHGNGAIASAENQPPRTEVLLGYSDSPDATGSDHAGNPVVVATASNATGVVSQVLSDLSRAVNMVQNELDVQKIPDNISCLSSAAVSLASREFSSELNSTHHQSSLLRESSSWKRSVSSLSHASLSGRVSSTPCCSDYPLLATTFDENHNSSSSSKNPHYPRLHLSLTLPLVHLVQGWYETVGWNISFSGIVPLQRIKRLTRANSDKINNHSFVADSNTEANTHAAQDHLKQQISSLSASSVDASAAEQEAGGGEVYTENNGEEQGLVTPTHQGGVLSKPPVVAANAESVVKMPVDSTWILTKLLERIPSATCLKKLENLSTSLRAGQVKKGPGGGHGNIGGATTTSTGGVEPIFKKLTDEIKALQANVVVYDEVTKEAAVCYQQVLSDIFAHMESHRINQEARLRRLEQEYFGVRWVIAIRAMLVPIFDGLSLFLELLLFKKFGLYGGAAFSLVVAFGVFVGCKNLLRHRSTQKKTAKSSDSVGSSCASFDSFIQEKAQPMVTSVCLVCPSCDMNHSKNSPLPTSSQQQNKSI